MQLVGMMIHGSSKYIDGLQTITEASTNEAMEKKFKRNDLIDLQIVTHKIENILNAGQSGPCDTAAQLCKDRPSARDVVNALVQNLKEIGQALHAGGVDSIPNYPVIIERFREYANLL
jgi:hypothetical protein